MIRWSLFLLLFTVTSLPVIGGPADQWTESEYLPGRLIVDFSQSINPRVPALDQNGIVQLGIPSLDNIFQEFEVTKAVRLVPDGIIAKLKTPSDLYRTYVLVFRPEYSVLDALDRLAGDANVVSVQPDILYRIDRIPNDAFWNSMWDKQIMGVDVAWEFSTGDPSIICAGIDTGVDWNHPDIGMMDTSNASLGWRLWVNPDEDLDQDGIPYVWTDYPGDPDDLNGLDDGENGYVDDFLGWDFINNIGGCYPGEDCDNMDNDMFGLESHGTHVGGLMAAHGNNGIGVAGGMWDGRLMALRAGYLSNDNPPQGYMPESATAPAIYYAAANGARVLNMSYGGGSFSPQGNNACQSAWNQGCLLFAASGNNYGNINPHYPAAYDNVIAVNSIDNGDIISDFSNYGTWTDLNAPGGSPGVWSTIINGYTAYFGTSMASPNAAGVGALLWSLFPEYTNVQIRDWLFDSAEDITDENPGIPPNYLGHGRVSAENAVASVFPLLTVESQSLTDASGDNDHRLEAGETGQLVLTVANAEGWTEGEDLTATVSTTNGSLTITNGTFSLGDILPGSSANNAANPVNITAAADIYAAFWAELAVVFSSPSGFQQTVFTNLRVGRGHVLIVDDDGANNYETYYETTIEQFTLTPDVWSTSLDGAMPASELEHYSAIIWECGNEATNTLTTEDQANLTNFLNAGGDLLLVGQNITEDIGASAFHTDVLHAQNEGVAGNRQLTGIAGNVISDGLELLLLGGACAGNGQLSPSRILPLTGAVAMFDYTDGGIGAVQYEGAGKVAYFAFALEAACGMAETDHHNVVIREVLEWFGINDAPEPPAGELPTTVALHGNYPNPFNPTTTISFDLSTRTAVELKVYDVTGREVATLVSTSLNAGTHHVQFDGSNLASGVYLVRLNAGNTNLS